ncbi:MAG: DNA-binding response regulator [Planctomycetota bacterium]|nr:MAG: DNA-binding response regulator [Planctomycetota bacterium]
MARILLVEDEPAIRLAVRDALVFAGHAVDLAADGERALREGLSRRYELIVLDLMLPRLDGVEVCRRLRQQGVRTPLLMLTARGREDDRVQGLQAGADDYVPKPFSVRELLARVEALLRRRAWDRVAGAPAPVTLRCGPVEIDLDRLEVRRGPEAPPAALTVREGEILRYLAYRRQRVVSKREFLTEVWGYPDVELETRTVENTIGVLRRKIEPDARRPRILITVRGEGFKLGPEVSCGG